MRGRATIVIVTLLVVGVIGIAGVVGYVMATGLSARARPGAVETRVARAVRSLAVPRAERARRNPVPASQEAFESGLAHFADHCATCHGNDGAGETETGSGLFPPPPDMRGDATQSMTDGELFYTIEHGVRFTGMPAFGTGEPGGERESWELVQFIRRLPRLPPEDIARMARMNPRSPEAIRQEIEDARFLEGDPPAPARQDHSQHGGH